jgi:ABC-type multidrug transport system permease subunit
MGVDLGKVALVLGSLAFQMHIFSLAMTGSFRVANNVGEDNAVQAFLIIAYLLFLACFILLLLMHYSDLNGNKMVEIAVAVMLFCAAASVIIGMAIYGNRGGSGSAPYPLTVYTTGTICGIAAGVLILLKTCM